MRRFHAAPASITFKLSPTLLLRKQRPSRKSCFKWLITGSIAGFTPGSFQAIYNATKAYIRAVSLALAGEVAGTGVTVNALAPGYTVTPFSQANQAEFHAFVSDWTPAKRWGRPEDICGAAVMLASDAGAYINGHTLYIDGGFLSVTK